MIETLKGIIVRTVDYKEKDKLLTIATFEKGLILVNAKGVRSAKGKLKSYAQLLCFGEFTLTSTRAGLILSGVDVNEMFYNCWTDESKYSACMIMIELIEKLANKQGEITSELMVLLKCLKEVNYSDNYPLQYALLFMCKIVASLGVNYFVLEEESPKVFEVVNSLVHQNSEENEIKFDKNDINNAIKALAILLKNDNNIQLKVVPKVFSTI
ncbi:MAG: DNA repair protein RecO [Clostridia bacterium]